ncbi:MAG: hypothetical protein GY906_22585 [bacterium]|nr:hypothetical protein [bacterium]
MRALRFGQVGLGFGWLGFSLVLGWGLVFEEEAPVGSDEQAAGFTDGDVDVGCDDRGEFDIWAAAEAAGACFGEFIGGVEGGVVVRGALGTELLGHGVRVILDVGDLGIEFGEEGVLATGFLKEDAGDFEEEEFGGGAHSSFLRYAESSGSVES